MRSILRLVAIRLILAAAVFTSSTIAGICASSNHATLEVPRAAITLPLRQRQALRCTYTLRIPLRLKQTYFLTRTVSLKILTVCDRSLFCSTLASSRILRYSPSEVRDQYLSDRGGMNRQTMATQMSILIKLCSPRFLYVYGASIIENARWLQANDSFLKIQRAPVLAISRTS